jgi:hypothetical protein
MWLHRASTTQGWSFPTPSLRCYSDCLCLRPSAQTTYLGAGVGPPPFSTDDPAPVGHLFTGMVSKPSAPPSEVEWSWMATPPSGTLVPPALVFGLPPAVLAPTAAVPSAVALAAVVVPALVARTLVVDGGSRRCQRSPARCGQSPPHRLSPRRDRYESPLHFFIFVAASNAIVLLACRGFLGMTFIEVGSSSDAEPP